MNKCRECGSYAVNPHLCGREPGVDLDLCDVCYWRTRAETLRGVVKAGGSALAERVLRLEQDCRNAEDDAGRWRWLRDHNNVDRGVNASPIAVVVWDSVSRRRRSEGDIVRGPALVEAVDRQIRLRAERLAAEPKARTAR